MSILDKILPGHSFSPASILSTLQDFKKWLYAKETEDRSSSVEEFLKITVAMMTERLFECLHKFEKDPTCVPHGEIFQYSRPVWMLIHNVMETAEATRVIKPRIQAEWLRDRILQCVQFNNFVLARMEFEKKMESMRLDAPLLASFSPEEDVVIILKTEGKITKAVDDVKEVVSLLIPALEDYIAKGNKK